jgi:hypothetical protein
MPSERRIEAARANGAKSRGPKTPAGKMRSSRTATRHGLLSECAVLHNESKEVFDDLLAQYYRRLAPSDDMEAGIVDEMAAAFWRIRRAWTIETSILNRALDPQLPPGHNEIDRIAGAFTQTAGTPHVALVHRYEARLHRVFQRALQTLIALRVTQHAKILKLPNEPTKWLKTNASAIGVA